jgi:hypothetical protein
MRLKLNVTANLNKIKFLSIFMGDMATLKIQASTFAAADA